VSIVTKCTTLADRLVFPEKGASQIRMTANTGLVDRERLQIRWPVASMGLMAIAAGEFFLADRMIVGFQEFAAHFLVTTITDACLLSLFQHPIFAMDDVATHAGDIIAFVCTAVPAGEPVVLVTAKAYIITRLNPLPCRLGKSDQARLLRHGMLDVGSVAADTGGVNPRGSALLKTEVTG